VRNIIPMKLISSVRAWHPFVLQRIKGLGVNKAMPKTTNLLKHIRTLHGENKNGYKDVTTLLTD